MHIEAVPTASRATDGGDSAGVRRGQRLRVDAGGRPTRTVPADYPAQSGKSALELRAEAEDRDPSRSAAARPRHDRPADARRLRGADWHTGAVTGCASASPAGGGGTAGHVAGRHHRSRLDAAEKGEWEAYSGFKDWQADQERRKLLSWEDLATELVQELSNLVPQDAAGITAVVEGLATLLAVPQVAPALPRVSPPPVVV